MSTRAYKLIEIKTEEEPTFNCSHNHNIYILANNSEDGNIISYERNVIEGALLDDHTDKEKEILKSILKDMEKEDYVEYFCC
jgi:hypothetical protein